MLSYHNDPKLKELIVNEMILHQKNDQFLKGTYEKEVNGKFKGCAVGCAIHSFNNKLGKNYKIDDHEAFEEAIGIPVWLARLQDYFFENLPDEESAQFAIEFLKTIPVGVNLEPVKWHFHVFLMNENINIVENLTNISDQLRTQVLDAVKLVQSLCENVISSGSVDVNAKEIAEIAEKAARAAADAAKAAISAADAVWSAAMVAARAARAARDADAAWDAAKAAWCATRDADAAISAADAVWSAARVAARAARDADAAWDAAIKKYSLKLLELLENHYKE